MSKYVGKSKITKDKFVSIYNDTKNKTLYDVANKLKISERTVQRYIKSLKGEGIEFLDRANQKKEVVPVTPLTVDDRLEIKKLKDNITSLKSDLKEAEKKALTSDSLKEIIYGSHDHTFGKSYDWMMPKKTTNKTNGIPTLFLSDIHFDEYVDPAQINFVNEFSREIATKRLHHTFNTSIDILSNHIKNPNYDGIVLALGGDLLSGNIHEELAETNEESILRSVLTLTDILIEGIEKLNKKFGKVFIPCVVGNHGRLHKKKRMKNKVFDNFEWIIYQWLNKYFASNKDINFLIPDGADAQFKVYDKSFLLTHGDQFRGGSGIAGIFSPLMLGMHRKQKRQTSVNMPFDVMMIGHFHQYIHTNSLVINGSVKGLDEYAFEFNFPFEPPQQALWINHPKYGMILRTPIICDSYLPKKESKENSAVFK